LNTHSWCCCLAEELVGAYKAGHDVFVDRSQLVSLEPVGEAVRVGAAAEIALIRLLHTQSEPFGAAGETVGDLNERLRPLQLARPVVLAALIGAATEENLIQSIHPEAIGGG